MIVCGIALGFLALGSQDLDHPGLQAGADEPAIERSDRDGEVLCSVRCSRLSAARVVHTLSTRFELHLNGSEHIPTTAVVSFELERRPLRQVCDLLAGQLGLRADLRGKILTLEPEESEQQSAAGMLDEASRMYLGLQRDFPEHAQVAEALFQRGWVEERRHAYNAAWASYDLLVERFPESPRLPLALFRSGTALSAAQQWDQAAERLSRLLRLESVAELEAPARTSLARALAHLGRSESALAMLDALEAFLPATSAPDAQERQYVRARALNGLRRWKDALTALNAADARPPTAEQELESLELRAIALEGQSDWAGASRNWLLLAGKRKGAERTIALRHAGRLALAAGDEVAVLFIASMPLETAGDPELDAHGRAARERLALGEKTSAVESPAARLARAERLLAAGAELEAHALLTSIHPHRATLDAPAQLRFARLYARALADRDGAGRAVELLREALPGAQDAAERREIYLLAGDIYERAGRLDDAIAALEGRL